jgi:hypothetical protein
MAYNEYLEQSVMGGVFGGILLLTVVLGALWNGWKNKHQSLAPFAGVLVFALMSLFNFTVAYPVVFVCFLFYAAVSLVSADPSGNPVIITTACIPRVLTVGFVIVAFVFVLFSLRKYQAQRQLTHADQLLSEGKQAQCGRLLSEIEPHVATSEAFYLTKARYQMAGRNLKQVRLTLLQLLQYTSNPALMQELAQVTARLGHYLEAERLLVTASGIEPHLFRPRVLLMEFYRQTGQSQKAATEAKAIIEMKPKFDSHQVHQYKKRARQILDEYQRPIK